MVSIEERAAYYTRLKESPKLAAFYNLLFSKTVLSPEHDLNETAEIYYGIVHSIQNNKKSDFEIYFRKKSKSNPSKESPSPFVNDDFLIFCLIVGVIKFGYDKVWIKSIVSIRNRNPITITLENILNENFFSKSNLPELVLMYLHLTNQNLLTNDFLNFTYESIVQNESLFESRNDIQIICSVRSYDLIIARKESTDGIKIKLLKDFREAFTKRIKILAWLLQTTVILLILFGIIKLLTINPQIKSFLESINLELKILGLFGISQIGNISTVLKRIIYEAVLKLFGYPKDLIDEKP